MKMKLILDIGNTRIKAYLFIANDIVDKHEIETIADTFAQWIDEIWKLYPAIRYVIISSVSKTDAAYLKVLHGKLPEHKIVLFSHKTKIPIANLYETPDTLGLDRLAAAIGANVLFVAKNVIVVDIGTAITFEVINENAEYLGGTISPGLMTRFRALKQFTEKLPLCDISHIDPKKAIGKNTQDAIAVGVWQGVLCEIEGCVERIAEKYYMTDYKIILTGGDAVYFEKSMKKTIFVEPDIVAIGLNEVLNLYRIGIDKQTH